MAITFSKTSGSGNSGKIDITSDVYRGRKLKSTEYSVTGSGASATIYITQEAYPLFINSDTSSLNVSYEGGLVTIQGKSNGQSLEVSLRDSENTSVDGQYWSLVSREVNGISIGTSDFNIPDDPGLTNEFEYIITIKVEANHTILERNWYVSIATDDTSGEGAVRSVSVPLIQDAEPSYVYVGLSDDSTATSCNLNIEQGGTSTYVYVMSNDSWTISEV